MSYMHNSSHLLDYQKLDGTILTFNLSILHTLIKKFNLIFDQVNKLLDENSEFQILYDELLTILSNENDIDFERVKELLPVIMDIVDKFAEENKYWEFSYTAPKKLSEYKLHIDKNGYLEIMKASVRAKFICVPTTTLRKEHMNIVRYIYNYICREMIESGVQFKLERIIDSIVLTTSAKGLDNKSQLWVFFTTAKGIDPQNLALRERSAIFYKGLPTIATGLNPINWFVSMARTSINFQMKDKINEIHIAFNAPIESCYENSADMLKVFVYEEVTSNRKLMKLFKEFPFALNMVKEYVYPITNWITAPFVSEVFNVANLNITHLINILLLNIFAYKFLRNEEMGWTLFNMLTYRAALKNPDDNDKYLIPPTSKYNPNQYFTTRTLTNFIKMKLEELEFIKYTIYTEKQLEELFKSAIKSLISYDYFDYNNTKIIIDPINLTMEYIKYIFNLLTGKYDDSINEARNYLRGIINEDNLDGGSAFSQVLEK